MKKTDFAYAKTKVVTVADDQRLSFRYIDNTTS